ncbi:Uncharacterised protein [Mycobacteroides abscessus]|nr:Uncharacterised protein [Mycobacteroides abscessus]
MVRSSLAVQDVEPGLDLPGRDDAGLEDFRHADRARLPAQRRRPPRVEKLPDRRRLRDRPGRPPSGRETACCQVWLSLPVGEGADGGGEHPADHRRLVGPVERLLPGDPDRELSRHRDAGRAEQQQLGLGEATPTAVLVDRDRSVAEDLRDACGRGHEGVVRCAAGHSVEEESASQSWMVPPS